jgi:hypothetical protein
MVGRGALGASVLGLVLLASHAAAAPPVHVAGEVQASGSVTLNGALSGQVTLAGITAEPGWGNATLRLHVVSARLVVMRSEEGRFHIDNAAVTTDQQVPAPSKLDMVQEDTQFTGNVTITTEQKMASILQPLAS